MNLSKRQNYVDPHIPEVLGNYGTRVKGGYDLSKMKYRKTENKYTIDKQTTQKKELSEWNEYLNRGEIRLPCASK